MRGSNGGPGPGLALALGLVVWACAPASPPPSVTAATAPAPTSPSPTTAIQAATPSPVAFKPTYEVVDCPEDVVSQSLSDVECGYLTVLEDRTDPAGATIRLFATKTDPPGGTTTPDPAFGGAGNLGADNGPSDDSAGAQRIHRAVYSLDIRGHDHSGPDLECPEVRAAGPTLAGLRLRDPEHRRLLIEAVTACRDRLVGQGIDLGAYDVAATVGDLEDLRQVLDLPLVNVNANLNGSRISSEFVRAHPDAVRVFVMDSPTLASPETLTVAPAAFDLAIENLSGLCAAQPACRAQFPDLRAAIRQATEKLDAAPVTIEVDGTVEAVKAGHPIKVIVDGAAYLRFVRYTLGAGGGELAAEIVRTTKHVLAGTLSTEDGLASLLAGDGGTCVGLVPACDSMSLGSLYSLVCGSLAPSVDQARLDRDIAGRPAYEDLFGDGPLVAACEVWPTGSGASKPAAAWPTDVPTLVMRGSLDPYSTPPDDIVGAIGGPRTYVYDVPNQSYNAFGEVDCPRLIRNAWIDAPDAAPADVSCLGEIAPVDLGN